MESVNLDYYGVEKATNTEKTIMTMETFLNEYTPQRYRYPTMQRAFEEWLRCVPSAFDTEIYANEQLAMLTKWFRLTPEKADKIENVDNLYYKVISREFMDMYAYVATKKLIHSKEAPDAPVI